MLGLAVDSGQAVHVPCGGDEPARAGCEGLGGGGGWGQWGADVDSGWGFKIHGLVFREEGMWY